MPSDTVHRQLVESAVNARASAYARYSGFAVGAAVLSKSGQIFTGVNIENASYGLTICAERAAVFNAVTQGAREFMGIAIATSGLSLPCGACRQVLAEFADDLTIWLVDTDHADQMRETSLSELLPLPFRLT